MMSTIIPLEEEIARVIRDCLSSDRINSDKATSAAKAAIYVFKKRIDENITEPYCKTRIKEMLK